MKRFFALFLASVMAALLLAMPAGAVGYSPSFQVYAEAAYIVNTDTNLIVYEKNSEIPVTAASLVKVMTCILLLENYQDKLDTTTCTAPGYIYDILYGKNASTADIRKGETVTLRQCLYAMLLPSANEAAYMVADFIGAGSVENFVARMNSTAKKIGCTGTIFTDPCGLDEGNKITARDAYLILRYAMSFDAFVQACATPTYDMGDSPRYSPGTYLLHTTNKMLPGASGGEFTRSYTLGGKTGTLGEWQNFAGWHSQNGENYISVVLHSPDSCDTYDYPTKRPALFETGKLMNWCYENYGVQPAFDTDEPLTEIPVRYSTDGDTVILYPADKLLTLLPLDMDKNTIVVEKPGEEQDAFCKMRLELPESVAAPVHVGDVIGKVSLIIDQQVIGSVDLVSTTELRRNGFLYVLSKVGEFLGSLYFRVLVSLLVVLVGGYTLIYAIASRQYHTKKAPKKRRK